MHKRMDKLKLRPILVCTLIGVLSLYALSLFSEKNTLLRKNRNLLQESKSLQETLVKVERDHQQLLSGYQNHEKESQNLQQALETLKKENESLQFSIKKNEASIESIKEEKSYLEEMLINKTKQIEILNSKKEPSAGSNAAPGAENVSADTTGSSQKDEELKRLNEQNRELQEKLDRLYKTTNAKINEINIAKIALEETVSTAKRKIEDEWNTVNLGSVTTSAVSDRQGEAPQSQQAKSQGHVLAINSEHGFVVVDLGKVDNLSSETTLEVRKNGQIIATLSVLEIRDVMAACNIRDLQDGQRIEINDPVSILR
jgi:chromosome segregation ATPase